MQIQIYQDKVTAWIRQLSDVRVAGQVLFVIIILLISWSGIKTIQANYALQRQISALNQQNSVQKLENTNLALQNEYYKSKQYLELAARQNFGLAQAGEKEVIVPSKIALSYTVNIPETSKPITAAHKPSAFQRHINDWVDFFLHRQSD